MAARGSPRPRGRPSKKYRSRGNIYPEQSSRQAMRGMRRAQGGPGIKLVGTSYCAISA